MLVFICPYRLISFKLLLAEKSRTHRNCGQQAVDETARVVRGHWGVEADNYIRDKTFKEDDVKTKHGNQAQIMGRLRGLAMAVIRGTGTNNFQEMIEEFMDSPDSLEAVLKQTNFL